MIVDEEKREMLAPLARNLALAYVAWQMGTRIATQERNWGPDAVIGEMWFQAAELIQNAQTEGQNQRYAARHKNETPIQ